MEKAKRLPGFMVENYHVWLKTGYAANKSTHERLADEGQSPKVMIISCCDSRVDPASIFGGGVGDFFVHRNIANFVPSFDASQSAPGTAAAVEFAVRFLKVSHIAVVGHSLCGGVKGCYDMCSGAAPEFEKTGSFIGQWIKEMQPGYQAIYDADAPRRAQLEGLEKASVVLSLSNLMTFSFVQDAVDAEELELHGLWTDVRSGELQGFDPSSNEFVAV